MYTERVIAQGGYSFVSVSYNFPRLTALACIFSIIASVTL